MLQIRQLFYCFHDFARVLRQKNALVPGKYAYLSMSVEEFLCVFVRHRCMYLSMNIKFNLIIHALLIIFRQDKRSARKEVNG